MEFTVFTIDVSGSLFYITHVDNIPFILSNGILSHDLIESQGLNYAAIYDSEIVSNRKNKKIKDKGLWHYANLYFQPRNPMLYRVIREKSPKDIAVIAVRKSIIETPGAFVSVGNAASGPTKFYPNTQFNLIESQINRMTKLQWWSWHDSSKRQIMSECLVPEKIPPSYIETIYVSDHTLAKTITSQTSSKILVIPEPSMFFQPVTKIDLTKNLSLVEGDLFFSSMQTLTVSVNCKGVMGKGLASRAKHQFPDVYVYYQEKCKRKILKMGKPVLYQRESPYYEEIADGARKSSSQDDTWFLLFPTKDDWKYDSKVDEIEKGLQWLVGNYEKLGITSLAIPALGCGLGNLKWKEMGPILCKYLSKMNIPVWIYLPTEKNVPKEFLGKEFLLSE